MRFLIDAQLPRRAKRWFAAAGCDAIHTTDLPRANRISDALILACAAREDRIVATKDADFVVGHLLRGEPKRLLLISTGNLSNDKLQALFVDYLPIIVAGFSTSEFLELSRDGVSARG